MEIYAAIIIGLVALNASFTAGTFYRLGRIVARLDHQELRLERLEEAA